MATLASCSNTVGDLTRAVRKGKNSQNVYQANFGKLTKAKEVEKWCDGLGYVLVSYKQGEVARFGGYEKGIVGARFMSEYDYDRMVEQERKRQLAYQKSMRDASQQRASNNLIKGGAILAGGYVLFKGLSSLFSSSSSTSNSSYRSDSDNNSSSNVNVDVGEWKKPDILNSSQPSNCVKAAKISFQCPEGSSAPNRYVKAYIGYMKNGKYETGTNVCGLFSSPQFSTLQAAIDKTISCKCY